MKNPLAMLFVGLSMMALGLLGLIVIGFIWLGANWYANTAEINECKTWQAQAQVLKGFYLTQWQADQCKAHEIVVKAPIQK